MTLPMHALRFHAGLTRRAALGAGLAGLALPGAARAELQIRVDRGSFQPLPIAIADFEGEGGARVAAVLTADLKRSGVFAPLDKASFPEKSLGPDSVPNFEAWKALNAQGIVTGRVTKDAGGRTRAEFRLWDVFAGQQLVGQSYATDAANWRRVAHLIADAVYTRVTGETGFFDTRVVFVDETGPKDRRRKRLAIMDADGANVRYLSGGSELVVTPRFSPTGTEVAYMAFPPDGEPKVYLLNIETGQREVVGNFPGMTFAPRFSPDGGRIVMSLQQGGVSNLYAIDLRSRATTKLTDGGAIDTSPSFSPDGSQIAFESDRGGSQQIYVMPAGGGTPKRISFGEGRYSTPIWSPKGDQIAFTRQKGGQFAIGVMKPDGTGERILAEGFHNEGPTWAPNGRYLMFFRDAAGAAGGKLRMVDTAGRVDVEIPTAGFASDPAWSPLLG